MQQHADDRGISPLSDEENGALPTLESGSDLQITDIRHPSEGTRGSVVWAVSLIGVALGVVSAFSVGVAILPVLILVGVFVVFSWIEWNIALAIVRGNAFQVTPTQYAPVYESVRLAAESMRVKIPEVYVLQGDGMFDLFVAKRYTRRGIIIVTSNMMDEFAEEPTSREFMFFIGRQLGHIKANHFRLWWLRDTIGAIAFPFYLAWKRSCHLTADRIGLHVAGDIDSSIRALSRITVGKGLAPNTKASELAYQRQKFSGGWAFLSKFFILSYPFMVDRVVKLKEYSAQIRRKDAPGVFDIRYPALRQQSLVIIHGHDELALLQVKDFLRENYPLLDVRIMASSVIGTRAMPEKFELIADGAIAAIALMTPDDMAAALRSPAEQQARARQNVIMEIGWFWARLGRDKLLLFGRGDIEVPSDFSGVELVRYDSSPNEKSEELRKFLDHCEIGKSGFADSFFERRTAA